MVSFRIIFIFIGVLVLFNARTSADSPHRMQKIILFQNLPREDTPNSIDISFPGGEVSELSVFGWVKPIIYEDSKEEDLIFQVQKHLQDNPTYQEIQEDIFLFGLILKGNCGYFAYRKEGEITTIYEPICQLTFSSQELLGWFFFYVGYSPNLSRTQIYVEFKMRIYKRAIFGTVMNPVASVRVLFQEESVTSNQFLGGRQRFALAYGPGAYMQKNFQTLTTLKGEYLDNCAILFEEPDSYSQKYLEVCLNEEINFGFIKEYNFVYVPNGEGVLTVFIGKLYPKRQNIKAGYYSMPNLKISRVVYTLP